VRLDQAPRDGEAETGAAAGARRVGPPQPLEHMRQLGLGDTAAAVTDGDGGGVGAVAQGDDHLPAGRGVPERVDQQVGEHTAELVATRRDQRRRGPSRHGSGQVAGQAHAPGLGVGLEHLQDLGDQAGQVGRLEVEGERARLDLRQLEQVVDQVGEPVHLGDQAVEVAAAGGWIADDLVGQRLGDRPQARQRGAQVVRGPGNQVAAAGLHGPLAGEGLAEPFGGGGQRLGHLPHLGRAARRDLDPQGLESQVAAVEAAGGGGQRLQVPSGAASADQPVGEAHPGAQRQQGEHVAQLVRAGHHRQGRRPQPCQRGGRGHRPGQGDLPGHGGAAAAQRAAEQGAGHEDGRQPGGGDSEGGGQLAERHPHPPRRHAAEHQPRNDSGERQHRRAASITAGPAHGSPSLSLSPSVGVGTKR